MAEENRIAELEKQVKELRCRLRTLEGAVNLRKNVVLRDGAGYWNTPKPSKAAPPQPDAEPPLGLMFPRTEATETDLHMMAQELSSKRAAQSSAGSQDSDGVTRKDVEDWMRYFDAHAEEFVAAHEAIIRKAKSDA